MKGRLSDGQTYVTAGSVVVLVEILVAATVYAEVTLKKA